jgi:hypothetical protein
MLKHPLFYIVAYLLGAIYTFGHCWNHIPDTEESSFGGVAYTIHNGPGTKMMASAGAAAFLPLYWSVRLQK